MNNKFGAIILAAGKGKRMKSKAVNKVTMHLANKPMILHAVELLMQLKIKSIVVVVGFAKKSVMELLDGNVIFAEQRKRLGTAHAVSVALRKMPKDVENVLVLNGDDSAFYTKDIIQKLLEKHVSMDSAFTFLTIENNNPFSLGRVVRDSKGNVTAVVEEKDATREQRKIKEVNPACYLFKTVFLRKYLPQVHKSPVTKEYYLTSLIDIGIKHGEKIETLKGGKLAWRGVNTEEELVEAQKLIKSLKSSAN